MFWKNCSHFVITTNTSQNHSLFLHSYPIAEYSLQTKFRFVQFWVGVSYLETQWTPSWIVPHFDLTAGKFVSDLIKILKYTNVWYFGASETINFNTAEKTENFLSGPPSWNCIHVGRKKSEYTDLITRYKMLYVHAWFYFFFIQNEVWLHDILVYCVYLAAIQI